MTDRTRNVDPNDDGFFPYSRTHHGSLNGYDVHRKRGTEICADCRRARSSYDNGYRRTRKIRERARARAFYELSRRHPDEFDRIFQEQRRRAEAEVRAESAERARTDGGELS